MFTFRSFVIIVIVLFALSLKVDARVINNLDESQQNSESKDILSLLSSQRDALDRYKKSIYLEDTVIVNPSDFEEVKDAIVAYLIYNPHDILGNENINKLELVYSVEMPESEHFPAMSYIEFYQYADKNKTLKVNGGIVRIFLRNKNLENGDIYHSIIKMESSLVNPQDIIIPTVIPDSEISRIQAAAYQNLALNTAATKNESTLFYIRGKWEVVSVVLLEGTHYEVWIGPDGEIIGRRDVRRYQLAAPTVSPPINGNVNGLGVRFDPRNRLPQLDSLKLSDLSILLNGNLMTYTDNNGNFLLYHTGPGQVNLGLEGKWADVSTSQGSPLTFTHNITGPGPISLIFNNQQYNEFDTAQVNGYYHTTFIHNWAQDRSGFAPLNNFDIDVNVNLGSICGGYYEFNWASGLPTINFGMAGSLFGLNCINSSYDTIIYHEYGHYLDDLAGGIPWTEAGSGLSEGWGDLLANYASEQPLMAEGLDDRGFLERSALLRYQYPFNGSDEVHELGRAWAGFGWELRRLLINMHGPVIGKRIAEELFMRTILVNSPDIPTAMLDLILIDDNDNDLMNGTPHIQHIASAGEEHALYPLKDVAIAKTDSPGKHENLKRLSGNFVPIIGTANATLFSHYQLFVGQGLYPQQWIALTNPISQPITNGQLGTLDLNQLTNGTYTIRLVVNITPSIQYQYLTGIHVDNPWIAIDSSSNSQYQPDMENDVIVWDDASRVHFLSVMYNVQHVAGPSMRSSAKVSGDSIVSIGFSSGNQNIHLYSLSQNMTYQITNDSLWQFSPDIDGNDIVFLQEDPTTFRSNVYHCVLNNTYSCSTLTPIDPNSSAFQSSPHVNGDYIVWQDSRNGDWDIYAYQISTGQIIRVTQDPSDQKNPEIHNNIVIWQDYRNGNWDIYYRILGQNSPVMQLTSTPEDEEKPYLSGDVVVWTEADYQSIVGRIENYPITEVRKSDIHYFNMRTQRGGVVTNGYEAFNYHPVVQKTPYGHLVVWQSTLGGAHTNNLGSDGFNIFATIIP